MKLSKCNFNYLLFLLLLFSFRFFFFNDTSSTIIERTSNKTSRQLFAMEFRLSTPSFEVTEFVKRNFDRSPSFSSSYSPFLLLSSSSSFLASSRDEPLAIVNTFSRLLHVRYVNASPESGPRHRRTNSSRSLSPTMSLFLLRSFIPRTVFSLFFTGTQLIRVLSVKVNTCT